jgi:lycopene cyclase CruA
MYVIAGKNRKTREPDLSEFRRRYPLTVAGFGHLANREVWLRHVWELDERWQQTMENGTLNAHDEVLVKGNPPSHLSVADEFEIIYAGGTLGLLHAAVMASHYKHDVLVFDAHTVGKTSREWNISDEELKEFEHAGLFTKEEIEQSVVNRYDSGFIKFHDANSSMKAPPLWMNDVLNVALDAENLLALAKNKIEESETGSKLIDGLQFIRAYITKEKIFVEVEEKKTEQRKLFAARLFIDSTGMNSLVSRQLNDGKAITHVCPTVGTIAKGFVRGKETDQVDFNVGEILVSTEDASDYRQLIWEGFAGNEARDEYSTYLFFYDAIDSPADKSLLNLFERYFESLQTYKKQGAQWRVVKPVFGFIPSVHHQGWSNKKQTAGDRVMLIGDAAGCSTPLTFCGLGAFVRKLRRLTHLTHLALGADMLDASALSQINANDSRLAQMSNLAEFMRPMPKSKPSVVNETMNALMTVLHSLDETVRRELFQDQMTFNSFKSMLKVTAKVYPKIFARMREHLGIKGSLLWLANIAESFINERRTKKTKHDLLIEHEDAKKEFEHYVQLYKK